MPPPLQPGSPRQHGRAPPAELGPELLVSAVAENEGGIRGREGGGKNAAELISSFEGDGELSQVHIKGQGNEC